MSAAADEAVPSAVKVRVRSAADRVPPTESPVLLVQVRTGVVSARRVLVEDIPITSPLYLLTRRNVPSDAPEAEVVGMMNHCWPTVAPLKAGGVAVGAVPQARLAVELESTPASSPVATLVIRYEPSPSGVNDHDCRFDLPAAATDQAVAQVAGTVGYDDPAYFTRVFTRNIGVPPREFRQQQKS